MPSLLPILLLTQAPYYAPPILTAEPVAFQESNLLLSRSAQAASAADGGGPGKKGKHKKKPKKTDRTKADQASANDDNDDNEKRPDTALDLARELGISSADNRPDSQRETTLLGERLIIGGKLTADVRGRSAYGLVRGAADDDIGFDPEATLEAIWIPSETSVVFAAAKAAGELELYKQGGGANSAAGLELNALWLLKTRLFDTPLAVQIGRQKMQERRNWWWDEDIDAVRLHYFGSKVRGFIGVGQVNALNLSTLGRVDPGERGLLRAFGTAEWEWKKRNTFSVFALHQNDRTNRYALGQLVNRADADKQDANLTWFGARARGCLKAKLPRRICYWGDIARLRGTDISYNLNRVDPQNSAVNRLTTRNVRGWAYDVGTSIELPFTFKPYLTLGYAWGSGDPAKTHGLDGAFRQSGFHKNDGKFRGLTRFRYYGEVLRPNLSNIAITTAALGIPIRKDSWIEAVWHSYRQPVANNSISGSKLDRDPNGISKSLGDEFDLILSHRPASGWIFELTSGAFRAGSAFGPEEGRLAGLVELKIDYNF